MLTIMQAMGDMPLRTCKTILQQVVTVYGRRSLDELDNMGMTDTSFVGAYLHRLVQGSSGPTASEPASRSGSAPTAKRPDASRIPDAKKEESVSTEAPQNGSDTASSMDELEVNQKLKEIFDMIGQPETSKQVSISAQRGNCGSSEASFRASLFYGNSVNIIQRRNRRFRHGSTTVSTKQARHSDIAWLNLNIFSGQTLQSIPRPDDEEHFQ